MVYSLLKGGDTVESLYRKAVCAWGVAIPERIKQLENTSDESVYNALVDILGDILSPTWVSDSRIAWALMQGREV